MDPLDVEASSVKPRAKYQMLDFFFTKRDYRVLRNFHDLNEADFVETMEKFKDYYRKQGNLLGLFVIFSAWDTALYKLFPISKIIIGGFLIQALGEISVYRNLDAIYNPLSAIFNQHYRPYMQVSKTTN